MVFGGRQAHRSDRPTARIAMPGKSIPAPIPDDGLAACISLSNNRRTEPCPARFCNWVELSTINRRQLPVIIKPIIANDKKARAAVLTQTPLLVVLRQLRES